jgi:hypothetical protein
LVALVGCALIAGSSGAATADSSSGPPLVQATVYPGDSSQTADIGAMDNCSTYPTEDDNLGLYGLNGAFVSTAYLPSGSSWSLSTVLSCGLGIPLGDVTDVVVQRDDGSFEAALSNNALTNASVYQDPGAPTALPVVGANGEAGGNNVYYRPWLGGTDDNIKDQVLPEGGPIQIQVYENEAPLTVTVTPDNTSGTTYSFSAQVQEANGTAIPTSQLTWNWSFGDGTASSRSATPNHDYQVTGSRIVVSVQATDSSIGDSGSGSTILDVNSGTPASGSNPHSGGPPGSTGTAPVGSTGSKGDTPGAGGGKQHHDDGSPAGSPQKQDHTSSKGNRHSNRTGARKSSSGGSSPTGGSSGPTGTGSPSGGSTGTSTGYSSNASSPPTQSPAPSTPQKTATTTPPPGAPVVAGLLVSDVTPLSANESPLVHAETTTRAHVPQVRRQVVSWKLPSIVGGVAALLLFLLGAGRERFWRRRVRSVRFGT